MKKLKANSILAAIIFCISILVLCSFGTDAAYVILSRYKLQKVTESIALEFASSKSKSLTGEENADECREIAQKYDNLYNVMGSGVVVFNITDMEYKADRQDNEVIVKVATTSRVMPAFLRFVGVKRITIYAVAYATTNKIKPERMKLTSIDGGGTETGDFSSGYIINNGGNADNEKTTATFSAPFVDENSKKVADAIIARGIESGDFTVKYEYDNSAGGNFASGGGFFILGGYEVPNEVEGGEPVIRWVDIGNKTRDIDNVPRLCVNPNASEDLNWATFEDTTTNNTSTQCFYCINAADGDEIVFDLSKNTYSDTQVQGTDGINYEIKDTGGRINTITHLRLYKAGGSSEYDESGNITNPCNPNFSSATEEGATEEGTAEEGAGGEGSNENAGENTGNENNTGENGGNEGGNAEAPAIVPQQIAPAVKIKLGFGLGQIKKWVFNVFSWKSINRDSYFTLTILNNISLANRRAWEEFEPKEGSSSTPGYADTAGFCNLEEMPEIDIGGN